MNRMTIIALAALAFSGCASQTDAEDHLEEGQPGVVVERITWGAGIPVPSKFTVNPGDHVERMTRTCELVEPGSPSPGPCRAQLDAECNNEGGIPLPDTIYRANFEDGEVVAITVTIKCKFAAGES